MAGKAEEKQFESWEEVIVDFIKERQDNKIIDLLSKKVPNRALNDEKQAINIQLAEVLKSCENIDKKAIEDILARKNNGKNKIQKLDFAMKQYDDLIKLAPGDDHRVKQICELFEEKKNQILIEHKPENWLDHYAEFADGVSIATHIAKLTHSSINRASSFYVQKEDSICSSYIATSDLQNPKIDYAIDNAAYTPIVGLLNLKFEDESLMNLLKNGDERAFVGLSSNKKQIAKWIKSFQRSLTTSLKASHNLAKQVYFPIDEHSFTYHLLCNVQSSTMAHAIFEETSTKVKKSRESILNKNKYYQEEIPLYFDQGVLAVTSRESAKNVSPLHSKRSGILSLFSCQPPTWQSQLKPPIYRKSLFDDLYSSSINTEIDYLRDFLLCFKSLGLSIKDPKRKRHLVRWVENIIDEFLFYVGSIQALPPGWSSTEGIRLKKEHQYLLDPYRPDDTFQKERQSVNWQSTVREDFARWLNAKLRGKDKQFTPQAEHTRMWKKLLTDPLREYMENVEYDLKQYYKESV